MQLFTSGFFLTHFCFSRLRNTISLRSEKKCDIGRSDVGRLHQQTSASLINHSLWRESSMTVWWSSFQSIWLNQAWLCMLQFRTLLISVSFWSELELHSGLHTNYSLDPWLPLFLLQRCRFMQHSWLARKNQKHNCGSSTRAFLHCPNISTSQVDDVAWETLLRIIMGFDAPTSRTPKKNQELC